MKMNEAELDFRLSSAKRRIREELLDVSDSKHRAELFGYVYDLNTAWDAITEVLCKRLKFREKEICRLMNLLAQYDE